MMKLGFVSAILPDLSLSEVVQFAAASDFATVELICWSKGKAGRRYAGVTHVDVVGFTPAQAVEVNETVRTVGLTISGLGYYPNPLTPDQSETQVYIDHIKQVILAVGCWGWGWSTPSSAGTGPNRLLITDPISKKSGLL